MKSAIAILTILACCMGPSTTLASQALQADAGGQAYTVTLNNTCHRDIRVAVRYLHPERGWVTQGWWEVPGGSEAGTGIVAAGNAFYLFGTTGARLQWPPENSRKAYNRYPVTEGADFLVRDNELAVDAAGVRAAPFSLKEIAPGSAGLKARFDC